LSSRNSQTRADWQESYRTRRLGWLLAAAVVIQFPYRTVAIACGKYHPLGTTVPRLFGYALVLALIANWTLNLAA
jgi:hypothetical protein